MLLPSMTIDPAATKTPYTDATQVSQISQQMIREILKRATRISIFNS